MSLASPKNPPLFEHEICSRCDGSGKFSYNLRHGSMCYGCRGVGYVLTKRGAAAQAYLNSLRGAATATGAQRSAALAYQATLTKAGTPAKRKAA